MNAKAPAEELLNVAQIAKWLQISHEGVRQRIRDGRLSAQLVAGTWRARRQDVESVWPDRAQGSPPPSLRVVRGGPQTATGKARSRMNATKLGLFAKATVIESGPAKESRQDFQKVRDAYIQNFTPQNDLELMVVEQLAAVAWRRLRIARAERIAIEESAEAAIPAVPAPDAAMVRQLADELDAMLDGLPDREVIEAWRKRAQSLFCRLHGGWFLAPGEDPEASPEGHRLMELHSVCTRWIMIVERELTESDRARLIQFVGPELREWVGRLQSLDEDRTANDDTGGGTLAGGKRESLDAHERHLDRRHAALIAELREVRAGR